LKSSYAIGRRFQVESFSSNWQLWEREKIAMALDAFVYCDCFEKHNLRCDPPAGIVVTIEPSGEPGCEAKDERSWSAFMAWKENKACLHQGMILLRHRLGTPDQIDRLRTELEKQKTSFPLLLNAILYSGTHTCDWIPISRMELLAEEVKRLAPEQADKFVADALQLFKIRIAELIIAAQHTGKPICF
jgi:hypothetical protein